MRFHYQLGIAPLILTVAGCQVWKPIDVESLPPTAAIPETSTPGKVDVWYFDGIKGDLVQSLLNASEYPNSPSEIIELTQLSRSDSRANNYGTLIRGYIEPPTSGEYTFYLSGDDETQLWLSNSTSPDSAVKIASTMATAIQTFTRYSSQKSGIQFLEANKKYYFEIRHKEDRWDDHFAVAWSGPGLNQQIITGDYLYSWAKQAPADSPTSSTSLSTEEAYKLGYKIGHFDSSQGLAYSPQYPPLDEDTDGLYDNWEVIYGLNPADPADADSDTDGDLLTATDEFQLRTSPSLSDTDGDGIPDGYEYAYGLDPTNPSDATSDLDGDGYSALDEYTANTDPNDATAFPADTSTNSFYATGFVGQYFSGINFDSFLFSRRDQAINFNWGSGSPAPEVPVDRFSVRWEGWFNPPHQSGTHNYTFSATTDDGVKLYLNGSLLIDQWQNQSPTTVTANADIPAETPVGVTVEYYDYGWDATAVFRVIDTATGTELNQGEVFESLDLASSYSESSAGDGIPDLYKLRYGVPLLLPSADKIFNSSGVSVLEAYNSNLQPYSLEPVAEPQAPDSGSTDTATDLSGTVTLTWTAPSTRVDGSSISLSEIDRYLIRYGQDSTNLTESLEIDAGTTTTTIEGLSPGTWYFTIQVVDIGGLSSEPSAIVEHVVK